jgi:hypothetical protein
MWFFFALLWDGNQNQKNETPLGYGVFGFKQYYEYIPRICRWTIDTRNSLLYGAYLLAETIITGILFSIHSSMEKWLDTRVIHVFFYQGDYVYRNEYKDAFSTRMLGDDMCSLEASSYLLMHIFHSFWGYMIIPLTKFFIFVFGSLVKIIVGLLILPLAIPVLCLGILQLILLIPIFLLLPIYIIVVATLITLLSSLSFPFVCLYKYYS